MAYFFFLSIKSLKQINSDLLTYVAFTDIHAEGTIFSLLSLTWLICLLFLNAFPFYVAIPLKQAGGERLKRPESQLQGVSPLTLW